MQEELAKVQAEYREMERKVGIIELTMAHSISICIQVEESREMNQNLVDTKERLNEEQQTLTAKLENLLSDNKYKTFILWKKTLTFGLPRNLKTSLLDSERYREEFREISEYIAMLKRRQKELEDLIKRTKEDLNKARMEGVMPKTKYYAPKFNKDTKVIVSPVHMF